MPEEGNIFFRVVTEGFGKTCCVPCFWMVPRWDEIGGEDNRTRFDPLLAYLGIERLWD